MNIYLKEVMAWFTCIGILIEINPFDVSALLWKPNTCIC